MAVTWRGGQVRVGNRRDSMNIMLRIWKKNNIYIISDPII